MANEQLPTLSAKPRQRLIAGGAGAAAARDTSAREPPDEEDSTALASESALVASDRIKEPAPLSLLVEAGPAEVPELELAVSEPELAVIEAASVWPWEVSLITPELLTPKLEVDELSAEELFAALELEPVGTELDDGACLFPKFKVA